MPLDPVQVREAFHCLALRSLAPGLGLAMRLKGGVNLRLFYGSERYSEDMDLDADPRLRQRLKPLIRNTLHDSELRRQLLILGIRDLDLPDRPAKDTDTVLRYKLGLIAGGVRYPTKIEVSYRGHEAGTWALLEQPLPEIVGPYIPTGTTFPDAGHYARTPAVWQKITALALRNEVQARDVFDLDLLLDTVLDARLHPVDIAMLRGHLTDSVLREAARRALDITFEEFKDQVVEFLLPERRAHHLMRWEEIQLRVASFIESIEQQVLTPTTAPKEE
jgi:Nucleotidyl transferase AbiEii toxin, Type IV TA system